ncbi:LADA_0E12508g1_1 [Lachancea dasiensis]|uniref:LADA_0E12508g1_1 n=1 Tax=Lachancea dasiensis TaxID=1072105 RepID=A0A1G4JF46_9SACH|nr:LADA_0E12508g1_1 [Lachancea dasiensis]
MGKKSSKASPAPIDPPVTKKKGRKGAKEETEEMKNTRLANRAKVTSTSSWTGKLPHTLLHENCQKRKWNKVEYDMKKVGEKGMIATAVLSQTDPKTKETLTLKMHDPAFDRTTGKGLLVPQETPMEARHMAATVALYRIASNSNMQMMLPPNHKSLWYDLDDYRKVLAKEHLALAQKLFDPEPFKTLVADRKAKDIKDKERMAKQQQAQKMRHSPTVITSIGPNKSKLSSSKDGVAKTRVSRPLDQKVIRFPLKVWENATFVDLKESSRTDIEQALRSHIDWNSKKWGGDMTTERDLLQEKLILLGFRKPHVMESLSYSDPLSFLLLNLPEDDLPTFFHKRQEDTKMKVEISSLPLRTQNMISRLMEGGASYTEVLYALESTDYDENEAAGKLTEKLSAHLLEPSPEISEEDSTEMWIQELESLQSIYGNEVVEIMNHEKTCYTIKLVEKFNLKLKVYKTTKYPSTLPGLIVSTFDKNVKLPNYIKQNALTMLLDHVVKSSLLGDMMVYSIYEWLQEHLAAIIDNPGLLISDFKPSNEVLSRSSTQKPSSKPRTKNTRAYATSLDELHRLEYEYKTRVTSPRYVGMVKQRSQLPAWGQQEKIVELIESHDVVLITGETGSGKSTQAVQYVLDYLMTKKNDFGETKIICTQPRRISAIGLAERVSEERCSDCGDEVGYVIRGVNKTKPTTRIKFMTTGVLVRILQGSRDVLKNTIVFIDEVHERSVDTDLIVILLKSLRGKIPGLKIVLMSATVNVEVFNKYFTDLKSCHIKGRTFPIKDFYLEEILESMDYKIKRKNLEYDDPEDEGQYLRPRANSTFFQSGQIDYDLISSLVIHVDKKLNGLGNDGSIVIFLPGVGEISRCCRKLEKSSHSDQFVVLPLHSALTPDAQKKVFKRFQGKRKVVVSTNIAETSITIDDCVATIDSGRVKSMFYSAQDNTTRLKETFVSKAEAKQRRGRAGRVRAGFSFKLFSKNIFEEMPEQPIPEIKRVGLESLYLSVKSMGIKDVIGFLGTGLDPPPLDSLQKSEQLLLAAGLLSDDGNSLTELGRYISLMPIMDHKHGKLLIYSIMFGCTDLGIDMVALLSCGGSPFAISQDNRDLIKALFLRYSNSGDFLAQLEIVRQYLNIENPVHKRKFMTQNYLSFNKMKEIISSRAQLLSILKDIGFLPMQYRMGESDYLNRNGRNLEITKAILTGSFYPQVARVELPSQKFVSTSSGAIEKDPEAKMVKYWIRNEKYIDQLYAMGDQDREVENTALPATRGFVHPSSVFFSSKNDVLEGDLTTLDANNSQSLSGKVTNGAQPFSKTPFIIYNSSHVSSKLYLRDVTPTSSLALLLFGGSIKYELQGAHHSPGLVVDNWLPIRTWCKNGVLIKELRTLLDMVVRQKLENPVDYHSQDTSHTGDDILTVVENILKAESL